MLIDMNASAPQQTSQYLPMPCIPGETSTRPDLARVQPSLMNMPPNNTNACLPDMIRLVIELMQPLINALAGLIENLAAYLGNKSSPEMPGTGQMDSPQPINSGDVSSITPEPASNTGVLQPINQIEGPANSNIDTPADGSFAAPPTAPSSIANRLDSFSQAFSQAITAVSQCVVSVSTSLNTLASNIRKPLTDLFSNVLKLFDGAKAFKSLLKTSFQKVMTSFK